jgi:hypothetical protein
MMDLSTWLSIASLVVGGGAVTGLIGGAVKLGRWQAEVQTKADCETARNRCQDHIAGALKEHGEKVENLALQVARMAGALERNGHHLGRPPAQN